MSSPRVRRLTSANTDEILGLVDLEDLGPSTLARELAAGDDYLWLGLLTPAGDLCAVHRSMRWGRHLLFKGVFVEESSRGSGAALELAFALRDSARGAGYAGIVAWVEPHKPEAGLARLLRLRQTGPLLHRFEVPVWDGDGGEGSTGEATGSSADSGTITLDMAGRGRVTPRVDDLLSVAEVPPHHAGGGSADRRPPAAGRVTVHWVLDRGRLVLSGFLPHPIADLPELTSAVRTLARAQGAGALEITVPAADVSTALSLVGMKARRLSRTPVRIGRLDFAAASYPKPPPAGLAGDIDRRLRRLDEARPGPR